MRRSNDVTQFLHHSASADTLLSLSIGQEEINSTLIDGLNRFKNLRALKFFESIELTNGHIWQMCLDELTDLTLGGRYTYSENFFVNIAQKFPKLERLNLYLLSKINSESYMELVRLCRNQKRKITIRYRDTDDFTRIRINSFACATDFVEIIHSTCDSEFE